MSDYAILLILGMTLITFVGFRLGGYVLGGVLPRRGRWAYVLDRLPAFVLMALLAPSLWALGQVGALAGGLVLGVTWLTGRALLAMMLGVALVAAARGLGF